jgi:hypothetical protein
VAYLSDYVDPTEPVVIPGLTYYSDVAEPAGGSSAGLWLLLAIVAIVLLSGKRQN